MFHNLFSKQKVLTSKKNSSRIFICSWGVKKNHRNIADGTRKKLAN